MITIYDLKPKFQACLRPLCNWLAANNITANQVTLGAALLSFVTGAAIYLNATQRWIFWLVPLVLFIRMALNAIDGMLAREHNMQSRLGAILNELGDVLADAALYLPFAVVPGISAPLVVTVVILAIVSEMAGVVSVQIGADRRYDGPLGKSDRAFLFGLIAVLLALGIDPGSWLDWLLLAAVGLLTWTIVNRCSKALAVKADV